MSNLIYSPKNFLQIYSQMESFIIGRGSKLSNFNRGSRTRTILEAVSIVSGENNYDYYEGLRQAIPVAMYEGLRFIKKDGTSAIGSMRYSMDAAASSDTLFAAGQVKVDLNGIQYVNQLPFVIEQGNAESSKMIPFEVSAIYDQGSWNAYTNSPSIPAASPGNKGFYYKVSTNGATTIDGIGLWEVGDWIISDGGEWHRLVDEDILAEAGSTGLETNIIAGDISVIDGFGFFVAQYGLNNATNTVNFAGGTDEESDQERQERFFKRIEGLTRTTPFGVLDAIQGINRVRSAYLYEYYPRAGWNTVYYDNGNGTYDPSLEKEMVKVLEGVRGSEVYTGARSAGIKFQFSPPIVRELELVIDYKILKSTADNPVNIIADADSAISFYGNNLKLGKDFIITEAHYNAQGAHPDVYDLTVTNITLNGLPTSVNNIPATFNEVIKVRSITSTYTLIEDV